MFETILKNTYYRILWMFFPCLFVAWNFGILRSKKVAQPSFRFITASDDDPKGIAAFPERHSKPLTFRISGVFLSQSILLRVILEGLWL
jgi:hypothetical protein